MVKARVTGDRRGIAYVLLTLMVTLVTCSLAYIILSPFMQQIFEWGRSQPGVSEDVYYWLNTLWNMFPFLVVVPLILLTIVYAVRSRRESEIAYEYYY